jgi:hypothetical protein
MIRVTIRVIWTLVLNTEIAHWIEHSTKILVPFDFLQDFCQILRIPELLKLTSWALVLCSIIIGPRNHKLVSFLVPVPCHCWLSIATHFFCLQNKSDSWRFGKARVVHLIETCIRTLEIKTHLLRSLSRASWFLSFAEISPEHEAFSSFATSTAIAAKI